MPQSSQSPKPARRNPAGPTLTGRYLILCRNTNDAAVPRMLRDKAGVRMASSSDFPRGAVDPATLTGADGIYLQNLGVAITTVPPRQLAPMMTGPGTGGILAVEPEHFYYISQVPRRSDHVSLAIPASIEAAEFQVSGHDLIRAHAAPAAMQTPDALDESAATWGLTSTGVIDCRLTGRGVRVAVLDTGLAPNHPDFGGRNIVSHSFIEGQTADDGNEHGTHCAGTAFGIGRPERLPRYSVAPDVDLYVGKVANNAGRAVGGSILAGIEWAIQNGCRIISLSMGRTIKEGTPFDQVYERVAQRALAANTLLIVAAGNESERPDKFSPVESPANCPSIMAVGAVDSQLRIASFSSRGMDANGGGIDIVAPGVNIYSSVPMPTRYDRMSGTSMATPHVAGIGALYAEANPHASAKELWQLLTRNARKLDMDPVDGGAGLVRAPG